MLDALIFPGAWLTYAMVVGGLTGWYPYFFLDLGQHPVSYVVVSALGVTALMFALSRLYLLGDRRMPEGRRGSAPVAERAAGRPVAD